jgi:hypothetical protein
MIPEGGRTMIAHHIHDALAQVRVLQEFIIERNLFKGYSGKARILAGLTALGGTGVLGAGWVPANPWMHLAGWGVILAVGVGVNYAALLYWFLFDGEVRRNPMMLKPAMDAIPALGVGAVLSLALILKGEFDLLFGMWMCLYGLAQVAYRSSLPKGIYWIGVFYVVCGTVCLFWQGVSFVEPWPMGMVFVTGELAGGAVLLGDHYRTAGKTTAAEVDDE